ncbi:MAG: helix-turn-helix transcriptional regulator [Alphaproteobacteria bacterium]|nr:helix-turn-helix transcriptional regulator [Alphaproteobacteria bacterium]
MKSTNRDDYQDTPRPFAGMAKDFADGSRIEPHFHPRAQLTWAAAGVMTVTAARGTWIVPPNRALWIPAGTEHAIRMSGAVAMRAIYVDAVVAEAVAVDCKVILVSPLLQALMLELVAAPLDYDTSGRMGHVEALFLDEIRTLDAQPLHIPMPRDKRLRRVCEGLLRDPGRRQTLAEWSAVAGASSRTLARLFERETGLRFVDWRNQVRLAEALVRLAQGQDVAAVARAAGYDSPSAFSAMFRTTLGKTPRDYFD